MKTTYLTSFLFFSFSTFAISEPSSPNDGIYYWVTSPLTGEDIAVKFDEIDTTLAPLTPPVHSAKFKRDQVPGYATCGGGDSSDASDISAAESNLAQAFASVGTWERKISVSVGNVVAFGCDYGNGQQTDINQYEQMMANLDETCGDTNSGWWSIPEWKASYGRTTSGQSFC